MTHNTSFSALTDDALELTVGGGLKSALTLGGYGAVTGGAYGGVLGGPAGGVIGGIIGGVGGFIGGAFVPDSKNADHTFGRVVVGK